MTTTFPMRFPFYCATTLLLLLATSRALDLTPHAAVRQGNEGPPTPAIQIMDGTKKITFLPPQDWLANGGARSLSFNAPGKSGAWMKLIVVPRQDQAPAATPVPDPSVTAPAASPSSDDKAQDWAKIYIPAGAQDVTFVKTISSPFLVLTRESTEAIFTFARYGSRESISISSVDFSDREQLVVIISAGVKDFDQVRRTAIGSMFSWKIEK